MNMEDLFSRMKEIGFTEVAPVKIEDLVPMPEIREMCAVDRCGSYGRKWSCPPYCGTLEECTAPDPGSPKRHHHDNGRQTRRFV